jgi:hypothetical protein
MMLVACCSLLNKTPNAKNSEKNSKSFMLPTNERATNGFENKIRWSFLNPLGPAILFEINLPATDNQTKRKGAKHVAPPCRFVLDCSKPDYFSGAY